MHSVKYLMTSHNYFVMSCGETWNVSKTASNIFLLEEHLNLVNNLSFLWKGILNNCNHKLIFHTVSFPDSNYTFIKLFLFSILALHNIYIYLFFTCKKFFYLSQIKKIREERSGTQDFIWHFWLLNYWWSVFRGSDLSVFSFSNCVTQIVLFLFLSFHQNDDRGTCNYQQWSAFLAIPM